MPEDIFISANFGLLPEPENRWGSFGVSTITNLVIAALLVLFTMASIHQQARLKRMQTTELVCDDDAIIGKDSEATKATINLEPRNLLEAG